METAAISQAIDSALMQYESDNNLGKLFDALRALAKSADVESLRADTTRARRLGFGAKLCIHPKQVAVVNAAFMPSDEEMAWARRVIEAAGRSQGAAVAVDGKMVDKPVILRAQAMLNS